MIPLYPRLLGSDWNRLHETVRRHHLDGDSVIAEGVFQIRHGRSWLARGLVRILRLPGIGDTVPTRLIITSDRDRERWDRTFGVQRMITTQWATGNLLTESFGLTELHFRLEAENGTLTYHQVRAAVRLGPVTLPLPAWLAPSVSANEGPGEQPHQTAVCVSVSLPLVGLLITYSGTLAREEAT